MKRRFVVASKNATKPIKASNAWFNPARASLIKNKLKSLMDILESCDAETYEAIDGAAMFDDLQVYAQHIDTLIRPTDKEDM